MEEKKSPYTIEWLAKFIAIIAIVSAFFGVSFQKGMIMSMNLGNLSGNYEIREIFNSAVLGFLFVFNKLLQPNITALIKSAIPTICIVAVIGMLVSYLFKHPNKLKRLEKVRDVSVEVIVKTILGSYLYSALSGTFIAVLTLLGTIAFFYIVLIVLGGLIMPSIMGYLMGNAYVENEMENDVCVAINKEMLEQEHLRQCTQITIKGKKVMGEVMLENKDAYFIRKNNAFLYITKDGENCIYSIFSKSNKVNKVEEFSFADNGITNMCLSNQSQNKE